MDIELSPEEVLRVRDGLDVDVVREIGAYLDEKQGPLFDKIRTIHHMTKEMTDGRDNDSPIPVRYLLSLERECYIFLSLLGGLTAHRIMVGAVKEYGNPDSEIYHLTKSGQTMKGLIQLLRVTVRGLGRFADPEDIMLLKGVKAAEAAFQALIRDESVRYALAGVMKWIDKTIQ